MAKRQNSNTHTVKTQKNDAKEEKQQITTSSRDIKISQVAGETSTKQTQKTVAPTYEQISERAKVIWQQRGCTPGEDQRNWFEAEIQLQKEMSKT
jgi:hypothetical protein